jgi:hypothetical protein
MTDVDLVPTDIIPLVNYAWECSFCKVESNKRAICDCGWYPLNRCLLLEPVLRETMTQKDIEDEKSEGLHPKHDVELQQEIIGENKEERNTTQTSTTNTNTPNMRSNNNRSNINTLDTLEQDVKTPDLNFGNGLTQHYIKHIINRVDREKAIDGIQADMVRGQDIIEKLGKVKRITAGALVKCGSFVIGKDVQEVVQARVTMKRNERREKKLKEQATIQKQRNDADAVIQKNRTNRLQNGPQRI